MLGAPPAPGRLDLLLSALEAARDAAPADALAHAEAFDAALRACGLSWQEVLPRLPTLAKMCGRLGSAYPAERAAAYGHALRELARHRHTWSSAVRLPGEPRGATGAVAPAAPRAPSPPDADWITTIRDLLRRAAWRGAAERDLLHELERQAMQGRDPARAHALLVRDIWWQAELAAADAAPDAPPSPG